MKQLILTFTACLIISTLGYSQSFLPIKDPNYKGVKVYSGSGYSGVATSCTSLSATYSFPSGISSVKVYGAWKLVNQSNGLAIREDDATYNGSGGGNWKLEKSNEKFHGIAYSESNFSGQATYLKMYKNEQLYEDMKSLKLNLPAHVGWADFTGYQKTYQAGNYSSLPYDLARADLHIKYATPVISRVTN